MTYTSRTPKFTNHETVQNDGPRHNQNQRKKARLKKDLKPDQTLNDVIQRRIAR